MNDRSAILLFDGTCGFCARSVQFVLEHERQRHTLRFASLQSATADDFRRRFPELDSIDSVVWCQQGATPGSDTVFVRSAAVFHVLRYLGGFWGVLAILGAIVPRVIRDWAYDLIARNRRRLMRGPPTCLVPTLEQRARFLDWDALFGGSSE